MDTVKTVEARLTLNANCNPSKINKSINLPLFVSLFVKIDKIREREMQKDSAIAISQKTASTVKSLSE